jgi:hypothetical protein
MTRDIFRWRIANTEADLPMNLLFTHGIPTPTQIEYKDHTTRISQSEGGIARHGYINVKILWTKLSPVQATIIRDFVETAKSGTGLLFMTINKLDGSADSYGWMDISGRPTLSDIVPDQPMVGSTGYLHSNIILELSNITILDDTPSF